MIILRMYSTKGTIKLSVHTCLESSVRGGLGRCENEVLVQYKTEVLR